MTKVSLYFFKVLWVLALLALGSLFRLSYLSGEAPRLEEAPHLLQTARYADPAVVTPASIVLTEPRTAFHRATAPLVRFFAEESDHQGLRSYRLASIFYALMFGVLIVAFGVRWRGMVFQHESGLYLALLFVALSPILNEMNRFYTPDSFLLMVLGGVLVAMRSYIQWPNFFAPVAFGALAWLSLSVQVETVAWWLLMFPAMFVGSGWKRVSIYWRSLYILTGVVVFGIGVFLYRDAILVFARSIDWRIGLAPLWQAWMVRWQDPTFWLIDGVIAFTALYGTVLSWLRDERRMMRFLSVYLLLMVAVGVPVFGLHVIFQIPFLLTVALICADTWSTWLTWAGGTFRQRITLRVVTGGIVAVLSLLCIVRILVPSAIERRKNVPIIKQQFASLGDLIDEVHESVYTPHYLLMMEPTVRDLFLWYLRHQPGVQCVTNPEEMPLNLHPAALIATERFVRPSRPYNLDRYTGTTLMLPNIADRLYIFVLPENTP